MRKLRVGRRLAVLVLAGLAGLPAVGQGARDIAGTWQGTLPKGKEQRIVVKVSKAAAGWQGVVYNLDADMAYMGRATTQMSVVGTEMRFAIAPLDATFTGKLSDDGTTVSGKWTQSGTDYALNLARAMGNAEWEIPKESKAMAADADPDWDVVTVRPADPDDKNSGFHLNGRQFVIERKDVRFMLLAGFGAHKRQIVNAPDWASTEEWDVKGLPDAPGEPSLRQMQALMRKVLVERFGLVSHNERREMEVYALTVTKAGEKLTPSAGDPKGLMSENDQSNGGVRTMTMTNASMEELALVMKFMMDRPVVDQTGLKGRYDFRLKWTFDESKVPDDGSAPPTVFTAIQEELGLKLEVVKASVDVMVIDQLEKPSAN